MLKISIDSKYDNDDDQEMRKVSLYFAENWHF